MLCQYMLKPLPHIVTEKKKKKGERKDCGRREDEGGDGALLPNSDLISEPEHTVCEDATRYGAAPFYPVGRLVL